MCFGSCTSTRPACSQCVGEPVTSVTLPAVVEKLTAAVPAERFVPLCSGRAAVSGCCWLAHRAINQFLADRT